MPEASRCSGILWGCRLHKKLKTHDPRGLPKDPFDINVHHAFRQSHLLKIEFQHGHPEKLTARAPAYLSNMARSKMGGSRIMRAN